MLEKISSNKLMLLMIFIAIIGIILMLIPIITSKKKKELNDNNGEISNKKLKKIDKTIDKEQLKKEIFNIYKKLAIAESKFDYDALKELLTKSLYKEEELKLKELKSNKQKIVSTNIKLQDIKILSIRTKDNITLINIYLYISGYDYVIDNKKKVIRGTDEAEYQTEYKLIIEKYKDNTLKISKKECTGKWIKNN